MSDLALPIVFMLFIVVAEAVALQWGAVSRSTGTIWCST